MKAVRITYRILALLLLAFAFTAGMMIEVPILPGIGESIRLMFYHVGLWFAMIVLFTISLVYSLIYMKKQSVTADKAASQAVNVAMGFGVLGIVTGMFWARMAWGTWWVNDPKLNGAAVCLLAYAAYKILRSSVRDEVLRARIASVYNILAYVMMIVFVMILPRTAAHSIHPGQSGNPALNPVELDATMRMVFYPAMLGWILLGVWIWEWRVKRVNKE
jgi:heme exporter protein C